MGMVRLSSCSLSFSHSAELFTHFSELNQQQIRFNVGAVERDGVKEISHADKITLC